MSNIFKNFVKSESGAVTVDWVVITAAVVGFAAISFFVIEDNALVLTGAAGGAVALENDF